MNLIDKIDDIAKESRSKVGIGVRYPHDRVVQLAEEVKDYAEILLIGDEEKIRETGTKLDILGSINPEEDLVKLLVSGRIDAAVRGNLKASETLNHLKIQVGLKKIFRIALLETASGDLFFLAPVGIDEGKNADEKVELIVRGCKFLKRLDFETKVGVLSGGRHGDLGRSEVVDRSLEEAEVVVRRVTDLGIDATHYQILIEDAIKESNIIIAPDGITGNLIFRTLVFLGGGMGYGAPILMDRVFIDTSRASDSYGRAIKLASALAGRL
ncbi:MAG: methanogenesis marker protein Mmp4/MtxX [Halobacteriota archaeon]|nr:methanogenesis marker protein Mmp4/MtxX [Halobacteriota archaeon]